MRRNRTDAEPSETQRAIMREVSTRLGQRRVVDVDPEDPAQQLDDLGEIHVEPLDVEARPAAEASEELDLAAAENVEGESEPDDELDAFEAAADAADGETGELYGVRTPHAGDADLAAPEDRDAFDGAWRGESWFEALEEHAAALGPAPEEEVVIVDDSAGANARRRGGPPRKRRTRPVADKGSGGAGGR